MSVFSHPQTDILVMVKNGFTLIELLVVMAILSIVMGLVGPLAVNSLEKAQARNEVMMLTRWLDNLSYRAFLSQQEIQLDLKGKLVTASSEAVDYFKSVDFEYLYFQPQIITFNRNGISEQASINYQLRDQVITILLPQGLKFE